MKVLRGYIFSRPFLGERAPQHIQNIVLRDYCAKRNFTFLLSASEYAMNGSSLMLAQIVENLDNIDGIVAYSLFQLPEDNETRTRIICNILKKKKTFHFAVEGLIINDETSHQRCELLWKLKEAEQHSLKDF